MAQDADIAAKHDVNSILEHQARRHERVISTSFIAVSMTFFMVLTVWCFWVLFSPGNTFSGEQKQWAQDLGKYALAYLAGAGTPQFLKTLTR